MTSEVLAQGGRWVRATHTEWCETYPVGSRPYHLEMPLLTEDLGELMDYPFQEELALCIPIGLAEDNEQTLFRFEGYCKSALLLARQLLHFTDMRSCSIPCFIGVSVNGLPIFQEYAQHCNFPESHIVTLPHYTSRKEAYHCKIDLLTAPSIAPFQRRLHLDAGLWLDSIPQSPFRILLRSWHSPETQPFAVAQPCLKAPLSEMSWGHSIQTLHLEEQWEQLAAVLGTTAQAEYAYWHGDTAIEYIWGGLFGGTSHFWKNLQHLSLIQSLYRITWNDEVVLAVVARECIDESTVITGLRKMFSYYLRLVESFPHPTVDEAAFMHNWRKMLGYSQAT